MYVLTLLGFKYPTVYQGWHTLIGACILTYCKFTDQKTESILITNNKLSHPRLVFISTLYVATIVSGSKALSSVPVSLVVSAQNASLLFLSIFSLHRSAYLQFVAIAAGITSFFLLLFYATDLTWQEERAWLLIYLVGLTLHDAFDIPNESALRYKLILSCGVLWSFGLASGEVSLAVGRLNSLLLLVVGTSSAAASLFLHSSLLRLHSALPPTLARPPAVLLFSVLFLPDPLLVSFPHLLALNAVTALSIAVSRHQPIKSQPTVGLQLL